MARDGGIAGAAWRQLCNAGRIGARRMASSSVACSLGDVVEICAPEYFRRCSRGGNVIVAAAGIA